jgi:integrase
LLALLDDDALLSAAGGEGRAVARPSGIHPKVASERLGHSKVGITLDLYSHVLPGMQEDAAAKMDVALKAAQKRN